ncbi:AMP-binding protein [Streptomyces anulatus]|uniref:(2,3-dihydroxybenzoyl)adenylate synthase n=1 Tax=Streptomyces anulatus TaxID=1892 RepID=UPI001C605CCF|nr:AMP-binding protein [Streptomyces anulatus]QYA95658.1 AMP-binding protein [Streptomyces anulatus]
MTADVVGWPATDAEKYRNAGYWRGESFAQFLSTRTRAYGDRTAVVDDRTRLSYAELDEQSDRVARGLVDLGIAAGDRVLVQLPNRVEFLLLWFALMKTGAVPVHTQPGHRSSEITHLARLSEAVAYVIPDKHADFDHRLLAQAVRNDSPALKHVVVVGDPGHGTGFTSFADLLTDRPAARTPKSRARGEDMALLLLSGGTTGLPKLIPRTHDDYLYNGRAAAEVCELTSRSVYLAALPVAFNYTMNCPGVLGTLGVGGKVVLASNPDPDYCFGLIGREGVTIAAINPQMAPVWLDEVSMTDADLSTLRVLQIGSARLADEQAERMTDGFGCTIQQVFGMAEGLLCLTRLTDPPEIINTVQGRPISPADEVRVVGPDDREVGEGEEGELLTRGPYTLRGYYRAAEHNARSFTPDGFYRSGDLVRRLPSGHLIVVGRSKDQINRGGEKIPATEVEGHLLAHPGIRSVALVAAPDPDFGERAVAFVVPAGERSPDRRELAAFLADRGLAAYKAPAEVRTIDAMPLTPVGKIDKKVLAASLRDGSAG